MGFENEFASYEPLRRILNSPKVQSLQDRLRIRNKNEQEDQIGFQGSIVKKVDFPSNFTPDYIVAIDGSY